MNRRSWHGAMDKPKVFFILHHIGWIQQRHESWGQDRGANERARHRTGRRRSILDAVLVGAGRRGLRRLRGCLARWTEAAHRGLSEWPRRSAASIGFFVRALGSRARASLAVRRISG